MILERIAELNLDVPEEIAAIDVSGIAANSSDIESGFLFFGLPGTNVDGAKFTAEAQKNGATSCCRFHKF